MGVLISMEERLSSWNDPYLGAFLEDGVTRQFPFEWAGHYDGLLDVHILRAHALNMVKIGSVKDEDTGVWELQVELDEAYANSIGIFDEDGNVSPDYTPVTQVADIKTMNPWGFKRIKEKGDVSDIGGYIDQIQYYMYMLNTPYGSIYIESKDNNDVVEVQIVWSDLHEGVEYEFTKDIHGEQTEEQVRVMVDSGRFFGDATREGCIPRLNRLWSLTTALKEAHAKGDNEGIIELFKEIPRCADKPDSFPCSWGHKTGKIDGCEFFEHCWSTKHGGMAVATWQDCPPEAVWTFAEDVTDESDPDFQQEREIRIDSRKVPAGINEEGFLQLVELGVLDYTKFLVDAEPEGASDAMAEIAATKAAETAINGSKNLFSETGELKMGAPEPPSEAAEYTNEAGSKAILCTNCGKETAYQKLAAGNTKKCTFCGHVNKVVRL
jgi:hypothetical protein